MKTIKSILAGAALLGCASAHATIVEFTTSQGNFKVSLYDETTPKTVENFMQYVNGDLYDNTIIHRVVPTFVVQGGAYINDGDVPFDALQTFDTVDNEPVWSNVRGTIAMAKLDNQPNSATSQWFFNLENNTSLDTANSGFTVFGQVIDDGMSVVNKIAGLTLCREIPLSDWETTQCSDGSEPSADNFVTIYDVAVIDDNANTVDGLTQVKNTLINQPVEKPDPIISSSGSLSYLFGLVGLMLFRRK